MPYDITKFEKYGSIVTIEGNVPLVLSNTEDVYLVLSGKAEAFCVQVFNNETYGVRNHLFSVCEGEAAFGLGSKPVNLGASYQLQLYGVLETRIICISWKEFFKLVRDTALKDDIIRMIDKWLVNLTECTCKSVRRGNYSIIHTEDQIHLVKGTSYRPKDKVVWVLHNEGSSTVSGDNSIIINNQNGYFPLADCNWMTALEEINISVIDTALMLPKNEFIHAFSSFIKAAFDLIQVKIDINKALEKQRLEKKLKNDSIFIHKAMANLINVLDNKTKGIKTGAMVEDPLYMACKLIGASLGIDFVQPALSHKGTKRDLIGDISRASRVRYRQIILKDEWWKKDNGPFLGFLGDSKKPVALINISPGSYEMYDPMTGEKQSVTRESASMLNHYAIVFYRPLPFKELNLLDILRFGDY